MRKKKKVQKTMQFVSMRLPEDIVDKLDSYAERLSKQMGLPVSRTQGLIHLVRTRSAKGDSNRRSL